MELHYESNKIHQKRMDVMGSEEIRQALWACKFAITNAMNDPELTRHSYDASSTSDKLCKQRIKMLPVYAERIAYLLFLLPMVELMES